MKVSIYKQLDDKFTVMLQASVGKSRPPVLRHHLALEDIKKFVEPEIEQMRRPKGAPRL